MYTKNVRDARTQIEKHTEMTHFKPFFTHFKPLPCLDSILEHQERGHESTCKALLWIDVVIDLQRVVTFVL